MTATAAESDPLSSDDGLQQQLASDSGTDTFIKEELLDFEEETPTFIPGFGISEIVAENSIVVRKMELRDRMKPPRPNKKRKMTETRSRSSPRYRHYILALPTKFFSQIKNLQLKFYN